MSGGRDEPGDAFPAGDPDERELLLRWLRYLRGAVRRKVAGVDEEGARWQPDGRLLSLLGIVRHLTGVEWRWVDGGILGEPVHRHEAEEFHPDPSVTLSGALEDYRRREVKTEAIVRAQPSLAVPCRLEPGTDLRWVLLHLLNETARHAGHADAVRELLDGVTGE